MRKVNVVFLITFYTFLENFRLVLSSLVDICFKEVMEILLFMWVSLVLGDGSVCVISFENI